MSGSVSHSACGNLRIRSSRLEMLMQLAVGYLCISGAPCWLIQREHKNVAGSIELEGFSVYFLGGRDVKYLGGFSAGCSTVVEEESALNRGKVYGFYKIMEPLIAGK